MDEELWMVASITYYFPIYQMDTRFNKKKFPLFEHKIIIMTNFIKTCDFATQ